MSLAATPLAHDLPWYFGLAMALAWAAVLALILILAYHRRQARLARRRQDERDARRPVRDDRSIGPGSDVELW